MKMFSMRYRAISSAHVPHPYEMRPFKFKDGLAAENIGKYIYCNKIQWIRGQQQIPRSAVRCLYIYGSIKAISGRDGRESAININGS